MTPPELVIDAACPGRHYWRDLWRFRELFCFLAWRDILVRYKQTVAGLAWAFLRPFLTMIVFTVVFGRFAKLPDGGVPYPLLVFAAVLPWQFFTTALSESGNSLVANANLVSKIYFPRLVVPASSVITSLIDALLASFFLGLLMLYYHHLPGWRILALPLFALLAFLFALGCGLWLSALTVRYRDFRLVTPFLIQLGFFISPVGYSSAVVPEGYRLLYSLNPMAGVIDGFRWAILGGQHQLNLPALAASTLFAIVVLAGGLAYFRATEDRFADVI